jgi:hypothetical protein
LIKKVVGHSKLSIYSTSPPIGLHTRLSVSVPRVEQERNFDS